MINQIKHYLILDITKRVFPAAPENCYASVRRKLGSYSQPAAGQLSDWSDRATAGTLSLSDIKDSVFPSCEVSGGYRNTQCYRHIPNHLFCWCVKPETGEYQPGSFQSGQVDCSIYSELIV